MSEDQTSIRQQDLEENIRKAWSTIKNYEDTLRTTLDPGEREKYERQIVYLRQTVVNYQTELDTLSQATASVFSHFFHSYALPKEWADRERELNELVAEIRDNRYRVIAMIAIGGSGKSALARKLLKELPQRDVHLECYLWFSFSKEPDVDLFFARACGSLLSNFDLHKYPNPFDKSLLLRKTLAQRRCLLVLDGLEKVLDDDWNSELYGTCKDPSLGDFLAGICSDQELSQVLITSRCPLTELTDQEGFWSIYLPDLSLDAAKNYILKRGVKATLDNITEVSAYYGYHVLALQVLADYLSQSPYIEDIREVKNLQQILVVNREKKLQSILEGYWQKLPQSGQFLMKRLAAFRAPFSEDILKLLAIDNNCNHCKVSHPEFHLMLQCLILSALVQVGRRSNRITYTTHPLFKTYVYSLLEQEEKQKIHIELKDQMEEIPIPNEPRSTDDLDTWIETYYQCIQAELYDEAYEIYRKQGLNRRIFWWGNYSFAIKLLQPLLDAYENGVWKATSNQAGYILQEAGIILSKSEDPKNAGEYHQKSIEKAQGNLALQYKGWQYLSELRAEMGHFQEAMQALESAQKIEDGLKKTGEPTREYLILGRQGYYNAALGRVKEGEEQLTRAIELCKDNDHGDAAYLCLYLRIRGDLYLYTKDFTHAHRDYQDVLDISRDTRNIFKDYQGHALRGLGDLNRLQQQYDRAREYYLEARNLAKETGYIWLQAEVEIGLALLSLAESNFKDASYQANEVLKLPKGSGWLIQQIQAHLVLARTSSFQGNPEDAKKHIQTAKQLLNNSDHFWSNQELIKISGFLDIDV